MSIFLVLNHLRKYGFIYLSLFLLAFIAGQGFVISNLKLQVKIRDNELITIENQAKQYNDKLLIAQEKYKDSIKKSQINSQRILESNVSDDCQSSIKWAIDQSKYFK